MNRYQELVARLSDEFGNSDRQRKKTTTTGLVVIEIVIIAVVVLNGWLLNEYLQQEQRLNALEAEVDDFKKFLRTNLQDAKTHIMTDGLENTNTERGSLAETFNTKLTAFEEEVKKEVTSELQPLPYVCLVDGGVNEGNAWKLDSTDSIWVPAGDPYPHHLPKKGLLEFRLRVTEAAPRTGRILNVGRFDVHISPVGILVDRLADGSLFVEVRSVNQYANVTVSTSGAEQFVQIAFTEQSFTLYIDGVVVAAPAAGFTSQASLSYSQDPAAPNTFVGYVCYLENKFKDAFWKRMMMNRVIKSRGYESDTTRKVSVMQLTDGTAITSKWKQLVAGDTVGSGNSGASIVDDWELFVHLSDFGNVGSAWMGDQSVSVDTNLFKVGGGLLSETVSSLSTQISSLSSQASTILTDLRSGCTLQYLPWTGAVNGYDQSFQYQCPGNYFVVGAGGWHSNSREDRQFIYRCATVKCSYL
eukprot:TRINITY_DN1485_c0_g1_i8.p1 TRINITY_DN1485_c0_g1~~TRINITY_DN1485_c0_g1_i8.p1  ORF type:complete len:471 (+),score=100.57 TRINITY_DN1485_c0_g1_i8:46-1458(+)